jgi:DNA-damage-inducible protein J
MENATISIRIDKQLKSEFDTICDNFGMNISTAFTIFAKKVVSERRIPFDITENDEYGFYSEQNMFYLRKSIDELERGDVVVKSIEELEELTNG